jgi:hypothetical protein
LIDTLSGVSYTSSALCLFSIKNSILI